MNGWLSPKGEFFRCPIGKHQVKARKLVKEETSECWVAIHPDSAFSELPITIAQETWLTDSLKKNKDETYHDIVSILLEKYYEKT